MGIGFIGDRRDRGSLGYRKSLRGSVSGAVLPMDLTPLHCRRVDR